MSFSGAQLQRAARDAAGALGDVTKQLVEDLVYGSYDLVAGQLLKKHSHEDT